MLYAPGDAKPMTGHLPGLIIKLQEVIQNTTWLHCFLHRNALVSKSLPSEMDCVMKIVIKGVNSLKGIALQTHIFRKKTWEF